MCSTHTTLYGASYKQENCLEELQKVKIDHKLHACMCVHVHKVQKQSWWQYPGGKKPIPALLSLASYGCIQPVLFEAIKEKFCTHKNVIE